MVMMVAPFVRALHALRAKESVRTITLRGKWRSRSRTRVLLTSAKGVPFTQVLAERYTRTVDRLIILCGHYEGVDERVAQYLADDEVSIGPYVLTGGELPALVIADAVTRLIPGVLGAAESLREESFQATNAKRRAIGPLLRSPVSGLRSPVSLEYPHYTRPADFSPRPGIHWRVPDVLMSGDHAAIVAWRAAHRRDAGSH